MTSNDKEAEELAGLAKEKELYLFEAVTTVYLPNFAKLQSLLPRIGTVKIANCNYSQYSRRYDDFRNGTVLPAFDPKKSGGALMDLNLYNLHYLLGLFGEIFYKDLVIEDQPAQTLPETERNNTGEMIAAPISGTAIPLSEIKDEVFSSGSMDPGMGIRPSEGKLYAPADGTISVFFPTGHAIGMETDSGAELLIHVGMDTVSLGGKGFQPKKKQGDHVKKGELLLEFDLDVIKDAGLIADTPVIVTNADAFASIEPVESGTVTHGDTVIKL